MNRGSTVLEVFIQNTFLNLASIIFFIGSGDVYRVLYVLLLSSECLMELIGRPGLLRNPVDCLRIVDRDSLVVPHHLSISLLLINGKELIERAADIQQEAYDKLLILTDLSLMFVSLFLLQSLRSLGVPLHLNVLVCQIYIPICDTKLFHILLPTVLRIYEFLYRFSRLDHLDLLW